MMMMMMMMMMMIMFQTDVVNPKSDVDECSGCGDISSLNRYRQPPCSTA